MPALELEGRELYYEVEGSGPSVVVLIHSAIADASLWDAQVEALAPHFRVVRYDVAGHGRSPLRPGVSHVDDLDALLHELGIDQAALVGNSFGGRIALEYALVHPEVVDALILIAPPLSGHEWSAEARRASEEEETLFEAGDLDGAADGQVRLWVDGPGRGPDAVDAELRERLRRMILRSYELWAEAAKDGEPEPGGRLDPPADERLGEIAVPTLVIVGDADLSDMLEIAERLEQGIPGARRVIVREAAHALPLERPEELNRLLLDFLAARD